MAGIIKYKGFSLIHLNILSLLRHIDEFQTQVNGYDIIAVTETWLTSQSNDRLLTFPNYTFIRQDRKHLNKNNATKKGGGILIYFKTTLEPFITVLDHDANNKHIEELWLQCKRPGHKYFTLGVIYRPPAGEVATCIKEIDKVLSITIGKGNPFGKELYLTGDFNVDYLKNNDADRISFKALETKYNMRQLIRTATRITSEGKSILDLIFTTINPDLITQSGTLTIVISDHHPVYLIKKRKRDHHQCKYIHTRSAALYNVADFANIIFDDGRISGSPGCCLMTYGNYG